jgi:hypothetical protein
VETKNTRISGNEPEMRVFLYSQRLLPTHELCEFRHSREGGNPQLASTEKVLPNHYVHWIPAFAGMAIEFLSILLPIRFRRMTDRTNTGHEPGTF